MNPTLIEFDIWLRKNRSRIFRYWVYRRMFTPFEEHEQFSDEDFFESSICDEGRIEEAVILPDNDILLGISSVTSESKYIEYYKLSEIRLAYLEGGEKEYEDSGE